MHRANCRSMHITHRVDSLYLNLGACLFATYNSINIRSDGGATKSGDLTGSQEAISGCNQVLHSQVTGIGRVFGYPESQMGLQSTATPVHGICKQL